MVTHALVWLVLLEILGLVAFPFVFRVFSKLPDRGWSLTKPVALLLLGFGTWVIGLSHTLPTSRWTVLIAFVAVAALSWFAARGQWRTIAAFLRGEALTLLAADLVFLVVFDLFVVLRAAVPEIAHTEQPMDFMFLNAVVTSPHFPPNDPWLSGNVVSYYYFGYLLVGALSLLSGIPTEIAYNLGIATAAALAGAAAFGIAYGLVRLSGGSRGAALATGAVGTFLLIFASNAVGAMEIARAAGAGTSSFWEGLAVEGLTAKEVASTSWRPDEAGWWWWRASRAIPGAITEFPMFSLILGDMHPHVMSIAFLLLAAALAVQVYLQPGLLQLRTLRAQWPLVALFVVGVGALGPLNLWDLPVGLALAGGALLLTAARNGQAVRNRFALAVAAISGTAMFSLALFAPFHLNFESSVGGVLPLRGILTRPLHLLLVWGALGALLIGFLIAAVGQIAALGRLRTMFWGIALAVGFAPVMIWLQPIWGLLLYVVGTLLFALHRAGYRLPGLDEMPFSIGSGVTRVAGGSLLIGLLLWDGIVRGERGVDGQMSSIDRLLIVIPMAMVVAVAIYATWAFAERDGERLRLSGGAGHAPTQGNGLVPALGLLAIGAALIMGVELFHVVDVFGGGLRRMNTVFKLYYQAWVLLSVVGAFGLWYVFARLDRHVTRGRVLTGAWAAVLTLALGATLYYPMAAYATRFGESQGLTLDGLRGVANRAPGEYRAIQWIRQNTPRNAVVVETPVVACAGNPAGCGDWTEAARISGATGRPTILGWEQHESQWRSSSSALAGRREDVRTIYETLDLNEAAGMLAKYNAQYIIVGPRERSIYDPNGLAKFDAMGPRVFPPPSLPDQSTVIYRVAGGSIGR